MTRSFGSATALATVLQVAMVGVGHVLPVQHQAWWFPAVGTLLGGVSGWLAAGAGAVGARAGRGAAAGGIAGVLGSLVSTALGDAPLSNALIAGSATIVAGAIGGFIARTPAAARQATSA